MTYGRESLFNQGVYTYDYFYKGVQCAGIRVGIWLDENGDCAGVWFDCKLEDKIALESVVPEYRGMKLQKVLNERYGWCKIRHKWLNICRYGEEYGLEWRIELRTPKLQIYTIWMNANTGEILEEDPMDPDY